MKGKGGQGSQQAAARGRTAGRGAAAGGQAAAAGQGSAKGKGAQAGKGKHQDGRRDFYDFLSQSGAIDLMVQALLQVYEAESRPANIRIFLARAFSELVGDHSAERVQELEAEVQA